MKTLSRQNRNKGDHSNNNNNNIRNRVSLPTVLIYHFFRDKLGSIPESKSIVHDNAEEEKGESNSTVDSACPGLLLCFLQTPFIAFRLIFLSIQHFYCFYVVKDLNYF